MLNYQLQIVGDEFVTSIGHDDEFYVNLLFDRSIYRPMCTHMSENRSNWTCLRALGFAKGPVHLPAHRYKGNRRSGNRDR